MVGVIFLGSTKIYGVGMDKFLGSKKFIRLTGVRFKLIKMLIRINVH